jgi:PAS domain S-box-containing protein
MNRPGTPQPPSRRPVSDEGPGSGPQRDLAATLAGLLASAVAAAGAETGAIYLRDADQGDLELVTAHARPAEAIGHRLAPGEGLIGRVVESGRSAISGDLARDPRAIRRRTDWDEEPALQSFLGLPLRTGSLVIGAIELCSTRPEAFSPEARGRAAILADAAALLIEQTRISTQPPPAALEGNSFSEDEPMGMLTVNARLRVTSANAMLCRLLGQPVEALVGRPAIVALPVLGRPRARDAMEAALRGTPGHLGVARTVDPAGGEQALALSLIPLGDPARGVAGVVILVLDMSERSRLEAELRAQHQRALEARDRLRMVVELVSHELRTPLTSVLGYARLMADRPDADAERRAHWADMVIEKARLMARLVEEITDLARLGSASFVLRKAKEDPILLLEKAAESVPALSDRHRVRLDLPEHLPPLDLDRDRIAQVLDNLLGNAIKFWPEGGDLCIRARQRPAESGHPRRIEISVIDGGPGVPAEQQARIFEPFRRGDAKQARRVAGTGLGLAISKGIVEAHGGQIRVEDDPGGGAAFFFWLPVEVA